jgi:hypothetical protein
MQAVGNAVPGGSRERRGGAQPEGVRGAVYHCPRARYHGGLPVTAGAAGAVGEAVGEAINEVGAVAAGVSADSFGFISVI